MKRTENYIYHVNINQKQVAALTSYLHQAIFISSNIDFIKVDFPWHCTKRKGSFLQEDI